MTYIAIPTQVAHLVRVEIEEKESIFSATSPDLGIIVTGSNLGDEFHAGIKRAISQIFQAMGQAEAMTVIRVTHPDRDTGYWYFAAIPQCVLDQSADQS